ncbi:MAG: hypothetical protein NTX52_00820, partial [Planctomycetota bacterium]|nr:hypothetical protein [Planctomycetota bacterium]
MQKQGKTVKRLYGERVRHNPPHSPAIRSGGQVWRIKTQNYCSGSVLALVVIALAALAVMGVGLLTVAYGVRHDAMRLKNETAAMLAAEAGYEQAINWMGQQRDVLTSIYKGDAGTSGALSFPDADCNYQIKLFSFAKYRPVYSVISTGHSGVFNRRVDVRVIQAITGWAMGMCRVPNGTTSTYPVNFVDGEIIDIPIHINNRKESPDERDIYIIGSPRFLQDVGMGESYSTSKYPKEVMALFEGGIYFNQPDCKITDEVTVQGKVDRFKNTTKAEFQFKPVASSDPNIKNPQAAVQLEFFVEDGVGKVRVTNNCTVRGFWPSSTPYDYKIQPKTDGKQFERYYLYAYHLKSADQLPLVVPLTDTYVTQSFGGVESEPGGQIFIDGSVVIGSGDYIDMVVKGKITVVASGNIWIADSVKVSDYDDSGALCPRGSNDMPAEGNPNVLGLVTQGVVKVVDPGMTDPDPAYGNIDPTSELPSSGYTYVPVAQADSGQPADSRLRHLPDPTVVEAAMTVGGGGWGAENVGGRKELTPPRDDLVVRGTSTEADRGVDGLASYPS